MRVPNYENLLYLKLGTYLLLLSSGPSLLYFPNVLAKVLLYLELNNLPESFSTVLSEYYKNYM